MNNPEQLNLQPAVGEAEDNKEKEVKLSVDYQNIRNEALALIDIKISDMGSGASEVARYEAAKERLKDNHFVASQAKVNNWEKIREKSDDFEEADKKLAKGLIFSALELN
jgi:hypothetical protein